MDRRSIYNCRVPYGITFVLIIVLIVFENVHSYMDMEELKSVYYGLDILNEPVVIDENSPLGAVHVTSKYGQQYQCSFPDHALEEKKKEEEEKHAVEIGIVEMLKPMASRDCLFKTKDWWSYEFCFGKYVRQYHMEDGEIRGNIIYLGYFESDFDWSNETAKDERLKTTLNGFHSQSYTQGTKCDLTGKMRTTEVRFMCEENSEDYLMRIDESQTCVYTVTVMTSKICPHPYFKSPIQRKSVPITCSPMLTQDQFDQFHEERLEREKRLERYKSNLKKKETAKKDRSLQNDEELSQILETEMSSQAKELLSRPIEELFPSLDESKQMTREAFEKMFGKKEYLWQLYQKGLEIMKKRKERKEKEFEEGEKEQGVEDGEKEEEEDKEKKDEDDEILSEFENEINEIKYRYQNSQNKLAGIRKKLAKEYNWESDIENAINEAEQEYGLKVDRSLVAGLSQTLNKLIDKLQDTEAELNSMDDEINSLKVEDAKRWKDEKLGNTDRKEEAEDVTSSSSESKETFSNQMSNKEGQAQPALEKKKTDVSDDDSGDDEDEEKKLRKGNGNIEDKIEAPPTSGEPRKDFNHGEQSTFPRPKDASEDLESDGVHGKPEVKINLKVAEEEEDAEDEINKLPSSIRKMLEESVMKEYEKKSVKKGTDKLGLDDDHSYTRDKTVHVIQHEDEEGRTNRFIFVLGFNNFDDESTELERQTTLEENYGFVYNSDKRTKKETATESEPDR